MQTQRKRRDIKEYRIWSAMKARCYAPSCKDVGLYQKNGITVCDRWRNSFENFMADMGVIPGENYSIERIDNSKGYSPDNCKWIPVSDQQKNRSNVPVYTLNGETLCLKEWSRKLGFNYETVRGRLRRGLDFESAIKPDPYERLVEIDGKQMTVSEWCEHFNINAMDVYSRIHRGCSKHDAITKNQESIRAK